MRFISREHIVFQPGDNASMAAKVEYCMAREGMAAFYAFKVAQESGGNVVLGPPGQPNIYNAIAAAVSGIDPRSNAYENAGIAAATAQFGADSLYLRYCSNPNNWKAPSYIVPAGTSAPPTNSYISSGSGSFWYVPEGRVDVILVPNDSNLLPETPTLDLSESITMFGMIISADKDANDATDSTLIAEYIADTIPHDASAPMPFKSNADVIDLESLIIVGSNNEILAVEY